MTRWALIVGGAVSNIVEQAAQPAAPGAWVQVDASVGMGFVDAGGGVFGPPPAPTLPRHITQLAFRQRFLPAERVALELAALDDPTATMPARQQAAMLRTYLADVAAARYVDLDRDDARDGVQQLGALGLLAAGRAAQILDAPVLPHERP